MAKKASKKNRKARRSMAGRVKDNVVKTSGGNHINMPRDCGFFSVKKEGRVRVDILPYVVTVNSKIDSAAEKGYDWFRMAYRMHANIGPDNAKVACLATWGKKCPICEYAAKLRRDSGKDSEEVDALLKDLRPKERSLYAIRLPESDTPEKILIWDVSDYLFSQLLQKELDDDDTDQLQGFADADGGLTLRIRFAEESMGKYSFFEADRIDFEERDDLDDDLLDSVPALDTLLIELPYDKLEKMFFGDPEDETDESDDDEDAAPPRQRKRRPVVKDEEDDSSDDDEDEEADEEDEDGAPFDDEEEDDDEEEEEPEPEKKKPTRSKKAKAPVRRKRQEVEEDDEDEEDEEPEPEPEKKRTKKSSKKAEKKPAKKSSKKPAKKEAAQECPFGYVFGEDVDGYDECGTCDSWEDCVSAS